MVTSTQPHEILYTDSQDMLVLSSIIASRYYNCCADSDTSPWNYGFPLYVHTEAENLQVCFNSFKKVTQWNSSEHRFPYRNPKARILCASLLNRDQWVSAHTSFR
jgi:hypothetical protein